VTYHGRAGYLCKEHYERDQAVVYEALGKLQDRYGLEVKRIKFLPASHWCRAMYQGQVIKVGMKIIREWSIEGYCEYKTLQYIIGLKWKRGEVFRRSHKTLIGRKAIQALMCHEYAHLLSYETYGQTFGRGHGIFFQQIVAEVYDFMFGPEFGAVDRFLNKKGLKWLGELHVWEVARKYKRKD
jgi:hypothetical protein